jgi:ABC-2 type transport system permease protein
MFKKEWLEIRGKLIWSLVIFSVLAAGIPLLHPLLTSLPFVPLDSGALNQVPAGMRETLLNEMERMRQDYDFYLWSQWAGKNLTQAGGILAVILGMGVVAGEYKQKTAFFLLARPISRARILGSKFASGITCLAIVIFASTLVMLFAARLTGGHFSWGVQIALAAPPFFGAVLIFALTAFFSSLSPGALPAAVGSLITTACSVLSPYFIKSNTLNILYHMAGVRLLEEGIFPVPFALAAALLAAGFFLLALLFFSRREVL